MHRHQLCACLHTSVSNGQGHVGGRALDIRKAGQSQSPERLGFWNQQCLSSAAGGYLPNTYI